MKHPIPLCLFFLAVLGVLAGSAALARTWTAKSGHKIEGEFSKLENDTVHIAIPNGKTAKVNLELLSDADQAFAKEQAEQQKQLGDSPFQIDESPAAPAVAKPSDLSGSNSKTVTVEGVGTTFEDAKKDAFRNAISQAAGTLVDSETRVTQDKVLEEILTASNAYIEKHKVLSQKQEEGLWHVSMEATVEYKALQMRLEVSTPTTSQVDGASVVGRLETKADSEDAPVLLLAKVFRDQNFPYSILEATAELGKEPTKKEGDSLLMPINITVKPNVQKFEEFRKAIEPVLEKIAVSKRTTTLLAQRDNGNNGAFYVANPYRDYRITKSTKTIFVHINTLRNNTLTNTAWNVYELPLKTVLVFAAYSAVLPAVQIALYADAEDMITFERMACHYGTNGSYINGFANCTAAFETYYFPNNYHDRTGASGSVKLPTGYVVDKINDFGLPLSWRYFFFAPLHFAPISTNSIYRSFYPGYTYRKTTLLSPDELKSVKTIKCTVISENPTMDEWYRNLPTMLKEWAPVYPER